MQALVRFDVLKQIDYLSTVSGGGYIGSALTWWLNQGLPDGTKASTRSKNFPLGRKYVGARHAKDSHPNAILNFIRQHGNYLLPGQGVNAVSLGAVILRAMFVSLVVYFAWLTLTMLAVISLVKGFNSLGLPIWFAWPAEFVDALKLEPSDQIFAEWFFMTAALLAGSFFLFSLIYSVLTLISIGKSSRWKYLARTEIQVLFGRVLTTAFVLVVIGFLPILNGLLQVLWIKAATAGASTVLGSAIGFLRHREDLQSDKPESGSSVVPLLAVFLLLYGLALGAFIFAQLLTSLGAILVVLGLAVVLGIVVNINYLGIHRMYRDRLMETFLANKENVNKNEWGGATAANGALIEDMCQWPHQRPYHLINTNIVLADSPTTKYRSRGGDSFVLSPLYCGSDATGWRRSDQYMKTRVTRGMTLPTGMAISAAAANPNTGVGGRGLTRNRAVSTLMSLLNLRLGYWAPNPNPEKSWPLAPNFLYPGLKGGVISGGLRETRRAIELTDGGHFENLALYELIRRKLKLIIVCDGGADPNFLFGDLANAVERVKVDFGVKIRFEHEKYDLGELLPRSAGKGLQVKKYNLAKHGFAVGSIDYPGDDSPPGTLLYLKTTLTPGLPPDIYGYKSANPTFPDQTTADQFFDEAQFEAYRELGYQLGKQLLKVNKEEKWIPVP